jgi:ribosome-associated translation inhibitor RaiA
MLNVQVRATNFNLTPAIDEYVSKKISSLQKFLDSKNNPDSEILCMVELGRTTKHHKSGDIFRAEVNITVPGKKQIFAAAE